MTTPILGIEELTANQAQPHLTLNAALRLLDALAGLSVTSQTNTPPGSPAEGDRYLVGTAPTGAWATHAEAIAYYSGGAWNYVAPAVGMFAFNTTLGELMAYGLQSPVAWDAVPFGALNLSELADVAIAGSPAPVDGDVLTFNGTNWVAEPSAAGGGGTDIQVFSTPGGNTWNKPTGAKAVTVICVGSGGGGGSGQKNTTWNVGGGEGGGGGGVSIMSFGAENLATSITATVGAGGAGGAGQTANNGGNAGSNGNESSFGVYLKANGGTRGQGGANGNNLGQGGTGNFSTGGAGGDGGATNFGAVGGTASNVGPGGGGGGSGSDSGYYAGVLGGAGGGTYAGGTIAAGGAAGGSNNGVAGGTGTAAPSGAFGGGGGGGGGSRNSAGPAGAGGTGGWPGGGGGGGGASVAGSSSGAGGTGGDGAVIVITYT